MCFIEEAQTQLSEALVKVTRSAEGDLDYPQEVSILQSLGVHGASSNL